MLRSAGRSVRARLHWCRSRVAASPVTGIPTGTPRASTTTPGTGPGAVGSLLTAPTLGWTRGLDAGSSDRRRAGGGVRPRPGAAGDRAVGLGAEPADRAALHAVPRRLARRAGLGPAGAEAHRHRREGHHPLRVSARRPAVERKAGRRVIETHRRWRRWRSRAAGTATRRAGRASPAPRSHRCAGRSTRRSGRRPRPPPGRTAGCTQPS